MKYYTLPNLATQEVKEHHVDNLSTVFPDLNIPEHVRSKEEYMEYSKMPTTKYCFFNTIQGVAPNVRINKDNPPHLVYGFAADYDSQGVIDDRTIDEVRKRCNPSAMPTFITRTFSGRIRMVWIFETPVRYFSAEFYSTFIKLFIKEAKVKQLFPGFDDAANREVQYFALGTQWTAMSTVPVSESLLYYWCEKVSSKIKWRGGTVIPMDVIKEEIESKWPGRWLGNFDVGCRGVRFWEESANNDTSAIVRENGMQCYTGDQFFMSWAQIFGRAFVEKYEADQIGEAISKVWFDGREYWRESTDGTLRAWQKVDLCDWLANTFDLGMQKEKGEALPEVRRAIQAVHELKIVDAACPLSGRTRGVFHIRGTRILNTGTIRPIPAFQCSMDEAIQSCRFILTFTEMFMGETQLPYYLAWLRRLYLSHLCGQPLPGQLMLVSGAVGIGKTFNSHQIIGRLLGAAVDASDFLMQRTIFNDSIMPFPIWTVDDNTPSSDPRWHKVFSAMMKMMAANRTFMFNGKYKKAFTVEWMGRVIVTCNADPESLRVLPDTDMSLLDKFNMFLANALIKGFKIPLDVDKVLELELPYFGRFLQLWEPPVHVEGGDRYGVTCYHHPELLDTARGVTSSASFLELLRIYMARWFSHNPRATEWEGTSTDLLIQLTNDDEIKEIAKRFTAVMLGRNLGQLMAQGAPISQRRTEFARNWVISRGIVA